MSLPILVIVSVIVCLRWLYHYILSVCWYGFRESQVLLFTLILCMLWYVPKGRVWRWGHICLLAGGTCKVAFCLMAGKRIVLFLISYHFIVIKSEPCNLSSIKVTLWNNDMIYTMCFTISWETHWVVPGRNHTNPSLHCMSPWLAFPIFQTDSSINNKRYWRTIFRKIVV